jgi:FkbM family methyltransferase
VKLNIVWKLIDRVGLRNTMRLAYQHFFAKPHDNVFRVRSGGIPHDVWLRVHGSDPAVYNAVIRQESYKLFPIGTPLDLVIDCGANIGLSAIYFLSHYQVKRLMAVEPHPDNARLTRQNLATYGDRIQVLEAGIWSHTTGLRISEEVHLDGREWSHMVRECAPGETATLQAVDINSLLTQSGAERISLLKIDIERSEQVVFGSNYETWLPKVDAIVIELHDEKCKSVFDAAIRSSGLPFKFQPAGECIFGYRTDRPLAKLVGPS